MRLFLKFLVFAISSFLFLGVDASANLNERDLHSLKGYTLAEIWTIEEFEGCEYDKIIKFQEGAALQCVGYGYSYSYFVDAFIFVKTLSGSVIDIKMVVDGEVYEMRIPI